jgi:hypothetical protein
MTKIVSTGSKKTVIQMHQPVDVATVKVDVVAQHNNQKGYLIS